MPTPAVNEPITASWHKFPIRTEIRSAGRRSRLRSERLVLTLLLTCGGIGILLTQASDELDRGHTIYREHCMECQGKPRTAIPAWKDALPAEDQQAVLHYIRSLIQFSRSPAALPPTP